MKNFLKRTFKFGAITFTRSKKKRFFFFLSVLSDMLKQAEFTTFTQSC